MAILIDGYNLLHATDLFGRGGGPGGLERSRAALLHFLVSTLDARELEHATVVFDAAEAPPGLPRQYKFEGLQVHFAANYDDADAMIEELIRAHHAPRQLLVVSSDHRLQRAANRRRATAIDSDRWYAEMLERRRRINAPAPDAERPIKFQGAMPPAEVRHWMREFGADTEDAELAERNEPHANSPFPPGYLEGELEDL